MKKPGILTTSMAGRVGAASLVRIKEGFPWTALRINMSLFPSRQLAGKEAASPTCQSGLPILLPASLAGTGNSFREGHLKEAPCPLLPACWTAPSLQLKGAIHLLHPGGQRAPLLNSQHSCYYSRISLKQGLIYCPALWHGTFVKSKNCGLGWSHWILVFPCDLSHPWTLISSG